MAPKDGQLHASTFSPGVVVQGPSFMFLRSSPHSLASEAGTSLKPNTEGIRESLEVDGQHGETTLAVDLDPPQPPLQVLLG